MSAVAPARSFKSFACNVMLGEEPRAIVSRTQTAIAIVTRTIAVGCLVCGVLGILVASAKQAPPADFTNVSVWYLIQTFLPIGLAGLHLLYLWTVLKLLIFDIPNYRLKARSLIIPTVLICSYVVYACDAYSDALEITGTNLKAISSILFMSVYAIWAARDWCESFECIGDLKVIRKFWIAADLAVVVFLLFDFVHIVQLPRYITGKDIIVAMCLVGYFLVRHTIVIFRREAYVNVYSSYLDALSPSTPEIRGNANAVDLSSVSNGSINIIDFGAGDGRRLWWFLQELNLLNGSGRTLNVLLYDKLSNWEELGWHKRTNGKATITALENAGWTVNVTFTTSFATVKNAAKDANLVHASHAIYDTKALREFSGLVDRTTVGCLFILRGIGSSIFRRMSEGVCLINPSVKHLAYLWHTHFMASINKNRLDWLHKTADKSCLVIDQQVTDPTQILKLREFLSTLYVGEWTEKLEGLYNASLFHEHIGGGLNNQDWLLFLRRK